MSKRSDVVALAVVFALSTVGQTAVAQGRANRSARPLKPTQLEIQVLLDRAGFSPGEIDGAGGRNSRLALAAFGASRGLAPGPRGRVALIEALRADVVEPIASYTVTAEDVAGPFAETIPADMTEKSKLPGLYYTSALEALGEKFHSAPALLKRLNPRALFAAGELIRIPNVSGAQVAPSATPAAGADDKSVPTAGEDGPPVPAPGGMVRVVVSKKMSSLKVYDQNGQVVFYAPVTSGSEHDTLPLGDWTVALVRRNPNFYYDPELFWDAEPDSIKAKIRPGPNNPVGVVWIDIDKPHYGIHGGPEPGRIGRSESHGCVRLTNWDVVRLAGLVKKGTPVVFEE